MKNKDKVIKKRALASIKRKMPRPLNKMGQEVDDTNLRIYFEDDESIINRLNIIFNETELPIIELVSVNDNYLLITTQRIAIQYNEVSKLVNLQDLGAFVSDEYNWKDDLHTKLTRIMSLKLTDGSILSWEVNHGSAYFAVRIIFWDSYLWGLVERE